MDLGILDFVLNLGMDFGISFNLGMVFEFLDFVLNLGMDFGYKGNFTIKISQYTYRNQSIYLLNNATVK